MTKLTDLQKKHIIADYVECQNYSKVAKKYNRSIETIRKVVKADETIREKLNNKKEQNTKDILAYMEDRKDKIQETLDALLNGINMKAIKIDDKASIRDLTMAYGIIIDKQFRMIELTRGTANTEQLSKVQELITKLDEEAKK